MLGEDAVKIAVRTTDFSVIRILTEAWLYDLRYHIKNHAATTSYRLHLHLV